MGRPSAFETELIARIDARCRAEEAAERAAAMAAALKAEARIPEGVAVSNEMRRTWRAHGFVVCPGERRDLTCHDARCALGARCAKMAALGLFGNGKPMARKSRPTCGATTRAGGSCAVKVEPGKRRCRFHGGMSTGPRTIEGRAKIAEAQRRRWAQAKCEGSSSSPLVGVATAWDLQGEDWSGRDAAPLMSPDYDPLS